MTQHFKSFIWYNIQKFCEIELKLLNLPLFLVYQEIILILKLLQVSLLMVTALLYRCEAQILNLMYSDKRHLSVFFFFKFNFRLNLNY